MQFGKQFLIAALVALSANNSFVAACGGKNNNDEIQQQPPVADKDQQVADKDQKAKEEERKEEQPATFMGKVKAAGGKAISAFANNPVKVATAGAAVGAIHELTLGKRNPGFNPKDIAVSASKVAAAGLVGGLASKGAQMIQNRYAPAPAPDAAPAAETTA